METDDLTSDFESQLAAHLDACARSGGYRVVKVLKASDYERTEKVVFPGAEGGELGPFVRKRIEAQSGLGHAYELLFDAQRAGFRSAVLPRIIDVCNDGTHLNVVMEWLPGSTLEEYVAAHGPGCLLARAVIERLCEAVLQMHGGFGVADAAPLIHRDLKPSNVMLAGRAGVGEGDSSPASGAGGDLSALPSSVVLIDLGIARAWKPGASADTMRLGTRPYAPPEQYGFGQTSVRSDVYALGAILYFCLTGEDPADGAPVAEQVRRPEVPKAVGSVIERAMAFDPQDRYASAGEFAAAAHAALSALPAPAASEPAPHRPGPARHRWQLPAALGKTWNALVIVSALLPTLASLWLIPYPTQEAAAQPLWFRVIEYVFWLPPTICSIAYLLLDKRRLKTRFSALARLTLKQELAWVFAFLLVSTVVVTTIGMLAGVV